MHHHSNRHTPVGGIILIILGLLFLFNNLDIMSIHDVIRDFWPVILILIGIYVIFKNYRRTAPDDEEMKIKTGLDITADKEDIDESNVFGDINVNIKSENFQKGTVRTVFGKVMADLTDINIADGENHLYLNTVFGEIRVKTAKNLAVKVIATNLGGDINVFGERRDGLNQRLVYQSDNYAQAKAKLILYCNVTFGEIHVW
ncbi:hypothetical protein JXQ31_19535 [candidate division KSB1 bacterium]|nr:hypothetical protein [candidate division KSB1 bacterium]